MTTTNPVIAVGVINMTTGMTGHKWSIYEDSDLEAYLTSGGFLILGAPGSFVIGESYDLIGNNSRRSLGKSGYIVSKCLCNKNDMLEWLKSYSYDYTPIKAFQKRKPGNKKLTTSYVLK